MNRLVFAIESPEGFLKDIECYTHLIEDAVTFTTFDSAVNKLCSVRERLVAECWVSANYLKFPRSKSL